MFCSLCLLLYTWAFIRVGLELELRLFCSLLFYYYGDSDFR
jgi:hypothetical protein